VLKQWNPVMQWWYSVAGGGLPVAGSTLLDRSRVRMVGWRQWQ
jgi:hypothetical protein